MLRILDHILTALLAAALVMLCLAVWQPWDADVTEAVAVHAAEPLDVTMVAITRARVVTATLRRTASRLFHEVHRLTTGVVAPTVFGPVLCMPWRHVHVDRRAVNRYRRPLNDDGLCIDQRRWTTVSDLNPAIHTRCQLSVHGGVHVVLRPSHVARQPQQKPCASSQELVPQQIHDHLFTPKYFHHRL